MTLEDKKGRKVIKADIDSEAERAGQIILFVVDAEASELMAEVLTQLKIMNRHLSKITDEEIKEGDTDGIH